MLHDVLFPPEGTDRHPPSDDLSVSDKIGAYPVMSGCSLKTEAETGDHLIEDQEDALVITDGAKVFQIIGVLEEKARVRGNGLDDHSGQIVLVFLDRLLDRFFVIQGEHDRVLCHVLRNTGGRGGSEGGKSGPGFHEKRIDVAVIAAVELDHLVLPCEAAGQTDRGHRGLRPGIHEADLVDIAVVLQDDLGQLVLHLGGGSERGAFAQSGRHHFDHLGMSMTQDQRSEGAAEIDVLVAVRVRDPTSGPLVHKKRRTVHCFVSPSGGVDPTGEVALRFFEEFFRSLPFHNCFWL